jgi:hypothetical protein
MLNKAGSQRLGEDEKESSREEEASLIKDLCLSKKEF